MNQSSIEISCLDVKSKLDEQDKFAFVDCRELDEWNLVRIEQAQLLPMSEIQQRIGELDDLRDEEVVVYCHHGGRSLQVAMWMRQQGFANAKSMAGGIDQWAIQIDSSLPRY